MYNYLDIICLGEKSDSVEGGVQERAQQAGLPEEGGVPGWRQQTI